MQQQERDAPRQISRGAALVATAVGFVIVAGLASWGIATRTTRMQALTRETNDAAVPTVAVVTPKLGAPQTEIVLPGNVQAYLDAPIYARTSGYLRQRHVDLGTRVKAGQLLAEIDAPELEQQLQQSRADLATAEANVRLAQITADRYGDLRKTDSVSQQDADNAAGSLEAKQAAAASAAYNVHRLEQLHAYTKIYAPFEGVITSRNTDVGALIDSGASGGAARELFHVASTDRLRVFVNVPEVHAQAIHPGLTAQLTLTQLPGRTFTGTLVRTARTIDAASRTLLAELEVSNPSGDLLAGSYAEVHLRLPTAATTARLPINTLIFRSEGLRIALVKDGNKVALTPISIGRDFGTEVEVLSGLRADDQVILDPPDSLEDGQIVRVTDAPPRTGRDRP